MRVVTIALITLVSSSLAACSDNSGVNGGTSGSAGTPMGGAGAAAGGGGMTAGGAGAANQAGGGSGAAGASGAGGGAAVGCAIPAMGVEPPSLLSQTGCVDMTDPSKPLAGFIPYVVRSPLWSDAAEKHRFFRLPEGGKIHVLDCSTQTEGCAADTVNGDDGHWEMPVGTVLAKNFSLEGKIIETRLVMRRSMTRWLFYGYEWNEAGTDATLLPDDNEGKDRQVGAQTWHYPGRSQCPKCHTPGGGFSLGPSTPQLNTDFAYAEGTMNQVEKLQQLGVFDAPPKMMPGYPEPTGADSQEQRTLSYLQSNCAICHRPSGEYSGMDMRWGTAIANMKLCDLVERDPGKNGQPKYRMVPGHPELSAMSFRVHALDELRMPDIGSNVVDPVGTKLIDDWITATPAKACPAQP